MLKMARQFRENKEEDELAGELDAIIYGSKKVTREDLNKNTGLRDAPESDEEAGRCFWVVQLFRGRF
jgi:hypothetical protein